MTSNAPSISQMWTVFGKIGLLSFGGPAAQISLMHRKLVEEKGWLNEKQYLSALSFCMLLPGPEAMQLATYAGWRLRGVWGGLLAGLLFVVPGACIILALGLAYVSFGDLSLMQTLFLGVKAAVLVIVIEALLRVAKRALKTRLHWVTALSSFVAIFFFSLPYPLIVLVAALFGFVFITNKPSDESERPQVQVSVFRTVFMVVIWVGIWLFPIALIDQLFGTQVLVEIGQFFSKLAVVTFGGAYAVLAYMTQDVVHQYSWLSTGEMMDGLGLAETTPGPLILVTEFVGFLVGFREGGIWMGLAGAALTLWVTFVPCFLWIFAGAPYIEWVCAQPRLSSALTAITAAVVGVILNLSLWFGLHVLFGQVAHEQFGVLSLWVPDLLSVNWLVLGLSLVCAVALLKLHWGIIRVLVLSAGLAWCMTALGF